MRTTCAAPSGTTTTLTTGTTTTGFGWWCPTAFCVYNSARRGMRTSNLWRLRLPQRGSKAGAADFPSRPSSQGWKRSRHIPKAPAPCPDSAYDRAGAGASLPALANVIQSTTPAELVKRIGLQDGRPAGPGDRRRVSPGGGFHVVAGWVLRSTPAKRVGTLRRACEIAASKIREVTSCQPSRRDMRIRSGLEPTYGPGPTWFVLHGGEKADQRNSSILACHHARACAANSQSSRSSSAPKSSRPFTACVVRFEVSQRLAMFLRKGLALGPVLFQFRHRGHQRPAAEDLVR